MTSDLDPKLAKALRGECAYSGCHEMATDGTWCEPHGRKERARDATWHLQMRAGRESRHECIDCGEKLKRNWPGKRCRGCAKVNSDRLRDWRARRANVVGGGANVVGDSADPALKKWKTESAYVGGYSVTRYAGRGRHGGVTREEKDDELRIHLRDAVARIQHVEQRGIARLRVEERELGTHSGKKEARILAADPLRLAASIALMAFGELHPDGRAAVREAAMAIVESLDEIDDE